MLLPLMTIGLSLVIAQARGGRLLRIDRLGRLESVHRLSERDHGRRRNGLRGLPDQPLSRLPAVGRRLRSGGQGGIDLDRKSDHRIRHHGGNHVPAHQASPSMGVFKTVGVASAIGIGVAFLAAVTLLPAILVLAGPRGWVKPRRELTARFWRRSGIRIVRRPVAHLVASLLVLAMLASCAAFVRYNYDDRKAVAASAPSSVGYAALDRHFPVNQSIPEYLLIQSPTRPAHAAGPCRLGADGGRESAQLPNVALVSGITRPTGNVPRTVQGHLSGGRCRHPPGRRLQPDQRAQRRPQPAGGGGQHAGRATSTRCAARSAQHRASVQEPGGLASVDEGPVQRRHSWSRDVDIAAQLVDHVNSLSNDHGLQLHRGQGLFRLDRPGPDGAAGQSGLRSR